MISTSITAACVALALSGQPGVPPDRAAQDQQSAPRHPVYVWWEAETPDGTSFPKRHAFAPATGAEAELLSGGAWIGADAERVEPLFAEYTIKVHAAEEPEAARHPDDGEQRGRGEEPRWSLYARKFWKHGPFRWRFDEGDWRICPRDAALLDETQLRQHVVANWVRLGDVDLAPGDHRLRIELVETKGAAALDCFVLVPASAGFTPRGKLKPGERWGRAPEGWFAFEPDRGSFVGSPISLRHLNEGAAGEKGRVIAKDGGFVREPSGEAVRFWGVNIGHDALAFEPADQQHFARRMAALGVNFVRLHGPLWRPDLTPDTERIARLQRFVGVLKGEGIYTGLSIYFPLWLDLHERHGFAGYSGQKPFGLIFFNPEFQALYREWWRALLTAPNPTTGVTLADEPALAICELVNEDSLFFWTFKPYETIPAAQTEVLEKQLGDWLAQRHGSAEGALWKWNIPRNERIKGDEPSQGRVGFVTINELGGLRTPRAKDTADFLAHMQRQFFEEHTRFLKKDLGFRGIVIGSNWITAAPRTLGPMDKWSNTACDAMDRHGYFGGPHKGPRAAYTIDLLDEYQDASALRFDRMFEQRSPNPILDIGYNGLASIISEINWPMPNRFRAELPLLAAAYGSLQGTDGIVFFAAHAPDWSQSLRKFEIDSPAILGQSPCAALIYRTGLVRTGEPVIQAAHQPQASLSIDPMASFVGPVGIRFAEASDQTGSPDLSAWIDRAGRTARSNTGELVWNHERGLVTLNAPAARAAAGFFERGRPITLSDVVFEPDFEYGSIMLASFDGLPLANSRRMLLQVLSEESNYGWSTTGSSTKSVGALGVPPIIVRNIAGRVTFSTPDAGALRFTPLDHDGRATDGVQQGSNLALRASTIWYVIER